MIRRPIVEVVPRRGARPASGLPSPLPDAVLSALAAIVADMRDIPRDCIRDPAELVLWLRRMAGRVEAVSRMTVPGATSCLIDTRSAHRPEGMVKLTTPSSQKVAIVAERVMLPERDLRGEDTSRLSGHALADAVFSKGVKSLETLSEGTHAVSTLVPAKGTHILRTPSYRTITSRKRHTVKIETRRSTPANQLDMFA